MSIEEFKEKRFTLPWRGGPDHVVKEVDDLDMPEGYYPLSAFIEYLRSLPDQVDFEDSQNLCVEFSKYGDSFRTFPSIYSVRPKTIAEKEHDAEQERLRQQYTESRERQQYMYLKAKYGAKD